VSEIESVGYERQRLLAALLGGSAAPPGIVAPLVWGAVGCAGLVATELLLRLS